MDDITSERMINDLAREFGRGQIRQERVFIEAALRMGVSNPRDIGERDYRAYRKDPSAVLPYYMRDQYRKAFGY